MDGLNSGFFSHDSAHLISESTLTQHRFAVKAMAAQYNNLGGLIQSGGGSVFAGTSTGRDVHVNNISSGTSNRNKSI